MPREPKQGELFENPKINSEGLGRLSDETALDDKFQLRLSADKIVFITLVIFVLLIVVFTLGVEHGKRLHGDRLRSERDVESISNLARVTAAKKAIDIKKMDRKGRELDQEIDRIEGRRAGGTPSKSSWSKVSFRKTPRRQQAVATLPSKTPEKSLIKSDEKLAPTPQVTDPKSEKPPVKSYEVRIMSVKKQEYADTEVTRLEKKGFLVSTRKSGNYHIVFLGPFAERKLADKAKSRVQKVGSFGDAYIRRLTS